MDGPLLTLTFAGFVGQGVVAVVLAAVVYHYYGRYRRSYLLLWAWSWAALGIYLAAAGGALAVATSVGTVHPARIGLSMVSGVAGYLSVACLLLGIYEIGIGRRAPRGVVWGTFGAAAVLGVVSTTLFAASVTAVAERMFLRVGVRGFVAGLALVAGGVGVWRVKGRKRDGLGPLLLAVSLVLLGLENIHYGVHGLYQLLWDGAQEYVLLFGYLDLVLLALVGMGMVVWLLEAERDRLVLATERIEYLAAHDPLTGLPHRQLFLEELRRAVDEAKAGDEQLGVLCLDLYGFKWVNESMGHRIGDLLLRKVGERLCGVAGVTGTVARIGGDEFAVLVPGGRRTREIRAVATQVVNSLGEPFAVGEGEVMVAASAGLSIYPDDASDPESLLSNAVAALAATARKGRLVTWEPQMSRQAAEGVGLEAEIKRALDQGELLLHYQPILDVRSGEVSKLEALIRWRHPERGLLAPSGFFMAADLAGLTERLDLWALEEALKRLWALRIRGYGSVRMAVNLAPANLERPDLPGEVRRLLQRSSLGPEDLDLEITEAAAIQIGGASLDVLQVLDRIGVNISLDDFGTGYSSLSYLQRLPVGSLKIDRSFVHDLGVKDQAMDIVRAIINLGRDLGLTVVGEGVESDAQWRLLEELGCDELQGYAVSAPVPGEELDGVLEELKVRGVRWHDGGVA